MKNWKMCIIYTKNYGKLVNFIQDILTSKKDNAKICVNQAHNNILRRDKL